MHVTFSTQNTEGNCNMSENQDRSQGFYEQQGKVRHMVILEKDSKTRLKDLSKRFNLTQGEVLDVMIEHGNIDELAAAGKFEEKKAGKREGKVTKGELLKKMKDLTSEQLAAIDAIVSK